MACLDLRDALGLFELLERFAHAPGERRSMFARELLVALSLLERLRMLLAQMHPFDLLLEEAERAAAARAPSVVGRKSDPRGLQDLLDPRKVDALFPKWQTHFQVRMG